MKTTIEIECTPYFEDLVIEDLTITCEGQTYWDDKEKFGGLVPGMLVEEDRDSVRQFICLLLNEEACRHAGEAAETVSRLDADNMRASFSDEQLARVAKSVAAEQARRKAASDAA